MPNDSFIVNYLGAGAAAAGIWQQAFPFGGCSEGAGGGLFTGAPARSPEHSKQGEPQRDHQTGGQVLPSPQSGGGIQSMEYVFSKQSWGGDER